MKEQTAYTRDQCLEMVDAAVDLGDKRRKSFLSIGPLGTIDQSKRELAEAEERYRTEIPEDMILELEKRQAARRLNQ